MNQEITAILYGALKIAIGNTETPARLLEGLSFCLEKEQQEKAEAVLRCASEWALGHRPRWRETISAPPSSIFSLLGGKEDDAPKESIHIELIGKKLLDEVLRIPQDDNFCLQAFQTAEGYLEQIPCESSTTIGRSLTRFDYFKMVTAIASALYYAAGKNSDWESDVPKVRTEDIFLLFSCDFSGIQPFLYTVSGKDTLKSLRSRSFFLNMLMTHIVYSLLKELGLSPANLIYSGGGRAYLLLPHTKNVKEMVSSAQKTINEWLLRHFGTALFFACACTPCSPSDLLNEATAGKDRPYEQIFSRLSAAVSQNKQMRYDAAQLRELNFQEPGERECRICRAPVSETNEENICSFCNDFIHISSGLAKTSQIAAVVASKPASRSLRLPNLKGGDYYLMLLEEDFFSKNAPPEDYVALYAINPEGELPPGCISLSVGNYYQTIDGRGALFEDFANGAQGVKRLGILRADVDNLGTAFVHGFDDAVAASGLKSCNRLLLTSRLSRSLSHFFSRELNRILSADKQRNRLGKMEAHPRKLVVVYSGGDDLFIAGAWNEVLEASMDLREAFGRFTGGALHFSGGMGLYGYKYPISAMAREVEVLEEAAKKASEEKNRICLLGTEIQKDRAGRYHTITPHNYPWDVFCDDVVGQKLRVLRAYFDSAKTLDAAGGNSFLNRLREYLAELQQPGCERINIARFAYLLASLLPSKKEKEAYQAYQDFSQNMYRWVQSREERGKLLTAFSLYIYATRTEEKE